MADLVFSAIYFVNEQVDRKLNKFSMLTCHLTDFFFESFNLYGVLLNLIMSVDRLFIFSRPFPGFRFVTYNNPKLVSTCLLLVSLLVNSPLLFMYRFDDIPKKYFGNLLNYISVNVIN